MQVLSQMLIGVALIAGGEGPPSMDDLSTVYIKKYAQVTTLRYESTSRVEAKIEPELVYREFRVFSPADVQSVVIYHRDGRLYHSVLDPWSVAYTDFDARFMREHPNAQDAADMFTLPYGRVQTLAKVALSEVQAVSPLVRVYDGRRLWQMEPGQRLETPNRSVEAFVIVDTNRVASPFLPETLLDGLLFGFDMPRLSFDSQTRARNRLPDLLTAAGAGIASAEERVDGALCVVVDLADTQRLWLDPALGFAVRKRLWFLDKKEIYELTARDFEKLGDDLWLPHEAVYTQYGHAQAAGGNYTGKPIYDRRLTVANWKLNDPADLGYLAVEIPAGSVVIDQTIEPMDDSGRPIAHAKKGDNVVPSVSYTQPANARDLDRVVREAQEEAGRAGRELRTQPANYFRSTLLWFNVGVLAVLVLTVVLRRRWEKLPQSETRGPDA